MRRAVVAGVALALAIAGPATGGGRLPLVAGAYTYELNGGTSHVRVVAFDGRDGASGSMRFEGTYVDLGGDVTCLTVHGPDAWIAGVLTSGDDVGLDGWMIRLNDHGARDRAVTFIEDFGLAMEWCEASSTADDSYLQPVIDGWVVVR